MLHHELMWHDSFRTHPSQGAFFSSGSINHLLEEDPLPVISWQRLCFSRKVTQSCLKLPSKLLQIPHFRFGVTPHNTNLTVKVNFVLYDSGISTECWKKETDPEELQFILTPVITHSSYLRWVLEANQSKNLYWCY